MNLLQSADEALTRRAPQELQERGLRQEDTWQAPEQRARQLAHRAQRLERLLRADNQAADCVGAASREAFGGGSLSRVLGSGEATEEDREGGLDVGERGGEGGLEVGGRGGAVEGDDLRTSERALFRKSIIPRCKKGVQDTQPVIYSRHFRVDITWNTPAFIRFFDCG